MQLFKSKEFFYRIPSLIKCKDVLIACCDKRYYSPADNPNRIDKIIKRSLDGGRTWSEEIVVVSMPGENISNSAAAIDPQLLYNEESNTLFMIYSLTPAGIGLFNSKVGTGYIKNNLLLFKDNNKFLVDTNKIYNIKTKEVLNLEYQNYTVNNKSVLLNNEYKIFDTSYLMLTKSTDLGATWSEPICLNPQVKTSKMAFIGAGPGVGCIIKFKNTTRLLFPIYYTILLKNEIVAKSAIMYSDDNGISFKLSKSPKLLKDNNPQGSYKFLTESQILVDNNIVYLVQRNHHSKRKVLIYPSYDFGKSFKKGFFTDIDQPISMIAAIKYNNNFLISNSCDPKDRLNGTLSLVDKNFSLLGQKLITKNKSDYFGYSSICLIDNNTLAILYENTDKFSSMEFDLIKPNF